MKLENVIKKLEKNGFWVRNTYHNWYEAKRGDKKIVFGGKEKVNTFEVGRLTFRSLNRALEQTIGKYNIK